MAAEINRGPQNLTVPNVEEWNPTFIGAGVKNFRQLISPAVNDVIKRHWSLLKSTKQNDCLMPLGTGSASCPLWAIIPDFLEKSRQTSLPYRTLFPGCGWPSCIISFHIWQDSCSLVENELEITCHDGKPDDMLRVERRRYGSAREVFRLSWGRTSLDPLDRYTVGSTMKSASFASQIVYTYIELFLSYKRLFTSTPRRRKIGWSSQVKSSVSLKILTDNTQ